MAQSSQVPPKFGNWDSGENVQYTAYFDSARKGKKGAKLNPNDPQDFPESESRTSADSPLHSSAGVGKTATESSHQRHGGARSGSSVAEQEGPKGSDTSRARHERQLSREEGDLRRSNDSPIRHDAAARKTTDSPHHRHGGLSAGDTPRKVTRQTVGSDRSLEHSPLHPQSHARIAGKGGGVSSPSWERKGSSEGSHGLPPSTPGRSRLRSVTRGDDTPDHSPAIPKFGDWDDNDPASAEGYTHIFNLVREEKQTGAEKVPVVPTEASHSNGQKRDGYDNSKCCGCFSWCRR